MIQKYNLKGSEKDGIFFTESDSPESPIIKKVIIEISKQNANLSELKIKMAKDVSALDANAIINFKYGQKRHKWWQLFIDFKWDSESWWGEGDAVKLED